MEQPLYFKENCWINKTKWKKEKDKQKLWCVYSYFIRSPTWGKVFEFLRRSSFITKLQYRPCFPYSIEHVRDSRVHLTHQCRTLGMWNPDRCVNIVSQQTFVDSCTSAVIWIVPLFNQFRSPICLDPFIGSTESNNLIFFFHLITPSIINVCISAIM